MTDAPTDGDISETTARRFLEEMLRIRRFENRVEKLFAGGDIPGFMHLSNGHEASHVGIGMAREADDWWAVGGARVNGQALAAGVPMDSLLAEMLGKVTGTNYGKGGHMHVSDVDRNLYGSAATIGQSVNPGAGLALAQEMLDTGHAAIAVLGDGGTTRGTFHTAMNLAAVWDLPLVIVIENNRFALSFHTEERLAPADLSAHAEPYGVKGVTIDGSDVETVYRTIRGALERAKAGDGPTLVEHKVHRLKGHYVGDKEQYRVEDVEDLREEWDPVATYRNRLLERDWLTQSEYDELVAKVDDEVEGAIEFAQRSDLPSPERAYEGCLRRPLYGQEE